MAKYSTECKRKVVQEYLVGHGNYEHIPLSLFTRWGRGYQAFSTDGFPHKENIHCRIEPFAVEYYLLIKESCRDIVIILSLNNPSVLVRWAKKCRAAWMPYSQS